MSFNHDLSDWLSFNLDEEWMEANVQWRDFGTGVRLGKLAREGECSLVLYDADAEVEVEAFMPHMHPGGECYLVLKGEVYDEFGTYPAGSIVWMEPESEHNPKTRERTLILVLWPKGVKIVES
jgi:anti-sigma factor ChrR (cupin superfamily)